MSKKYTLENVGIGTELAKRFYLDGVVLKKECKCGSVMEKDLGDYNLDYPYVGCPESIYMYCKECGAEYEDVLKVTIRINLDVEQL